MVFTGLLGESANSKCNEVVKLPPSIPSSSSIASASKPASKNFIGFVSATSSAAMKQTVYAKPKAKNVAVKSTDVLLQPVGVATSSKSKKSSDEVPKAKKSLDRVLTNDNKQGSKQSESNSKSEKTKHNDAAKPLKQDKSSKVQLAKIETRPERVKRLLISPQTKFYCLFFDNIIPVEKVNTLLQKEESMIHKLRRELIGLLQSLLVRFVLPKAMIDIPLLEVKYSEKKNQKVDEDLVVGNKVKQYIATHTTGTASEAEPQAVILDENDMKSFYLSIRLFYTTAADYVSQKLPLREELLQHAEVADVSVRIEKSFSDVNYFIKRFECLLPLPAESTFDDEFNKLEEEFANFQVASLPSTIIQVERIDIQWKLLSKDYPYLANVMLGVLTIPHSNAACERIFSIVRKNKTDFRASLGKETLQSLLIEKVDSCSSGTACYEKKFSKEFLKKS